MNRRFDLGLLLGPALVAVVVALVLPAGLDLPPWGWLLFVVALDVAHVWASLFRTYLVPGEVRRRPVLYLGTPLACLLVLLGLRAGGTAWFWTAMAYAALYHFIKQQAGVAMLYRRRAGLGRDGARLERWAIYVACGWPVLWWHAHLPQSFSWFVEGDFLVGLPVGLLGPAALVSVAVLFLHTRQRLREGLWTPGRDLWLAMTAAVWGGGIVLGGGDAAFTLTNVVHHGLVYFALIAWASGGLWRVRGSGPAWPDWFRGSGVVLFLTPLLALALVEEGLWDALVWHEHSWLFGAWPEPPPWLAWVAVPVLAVPQVTHYVLDGFIWRFDGSNPGLAEALGLDGPARSEGQDVSRRQ